MAGGVAYHWDVQYMLDYLAPRLPSAQRDFATAILAGINTPELAAGLDRFSLWRDTETISRDIPWPVEGG